MNKSSHQSEKVKLHQSQKSSVKQSYVNLDLEAQETTAAPHAETRRIATLLNQRRDSHFSKLNLKKIKAKKVSPDNNKDITSQTGTTPSLLEVVTNDFSTCDTNRKRSPLLGYTTKLKNQKRLNEITYSNERLGHGNLFSSGLSSPKLRIHDQRLRVRVDTVSNGKQLTGLLSSVSVSNTPITTKSEKLTKVIKEVPPGFKPVNMAERSYNNTIENDCSVADIKLLKEYGKAQASPTLLENDKNEPKSNLFKEKEEREIREANKKIQTSIQNGMLKHFSLGNIANETEGLTNGFNKTRSNINKSSTKRTSILILFDQGLDFIEDYLRDFQLSLRLVFEKIENFENIVQGGANDKQSNTYKRSSYLPYFCVFAFLKIAPKVNPKSLEIVKELMKTKCCFITKCFLPMEGLNLNLDYKNDIVTAEWKKNFERTLFLKPSKFGTLTVTYEEFHALKEFIIAKSKLYLDHGKCCQCK